MKTQQARALTQLSRSGFELDYGIRYRAARGNKEVYISHDDETTDDKDKAARMSYDLANEKYMTMLRKTVGNPGLEHFKTAEIVPLARRQVVSRRPRKGVHRVNGKATTRSH